MLWGGGWFFERGEGSPSAMPEGGGEAGMGVRRKKGLKGGLRARGEPRRLSRRRLALSRKSPAAGFPLLQAPLARGHAISQRVREAACCSRPHPRALVENEGVSGREKESGVVGGARGGGGGGEREGARAGVFFAFFWCLVVGVVRWWFCVGRRGAGCVCVWERAHAHNTPTRTARARSLSAVPQAVAASAEATRRRQQRRERGAVGRRRARVQRARGASRVRLVRRVRAGHVVGAARPARRGGHGRDAEAARLALPALLADRAVARADGRKGGRSRGEAAASATAAAHRERRQRRRRRRGRHASSRETSVAA